MALVAQTVKEFRAAGIPGRLPEGKYYIHYTDATHLPDGEWVQLATIVLEGPGGRAEPGQDAAAAFFTIQPAVEVKPKGQEKEDHLRERTRVLQRQLAQSFLRTGLLRPILHAAGFREIWKLSREPALVLVPDTNALATGTLHWLLRSLRKTQVWLLPVVVSLTQIQQRDAILKAMVQNPKKGGDPRQAVPSRTLVNASLSLLERYRNRYQVLEVDPQLLRYVRPAGRASGDPDDADVLEDRLLVEAIHAVFRSSRSATERRVVTSDVLLARILNAEAIPFVFLATPELSQEALPCIRYEPLAGTFHGCTLPHLLWDLAHSFGTVCLRREEGREVLKLETYWAGKTARDWIEERLQVTAIEERRDATATSAKAGTFSKAAVPEASLVSVLHIAAALAAGRGAALDTLLGRIPKEMRLSEDVARMAAEVLLRAGLVGTREGEIHPTPRLEELRQAWQGGDLDRMSQLFEGYEPYFLVMEELRGRGHLDQKTPSEGLRVRLGEPGPSRDAYERLVRYPVYLGQAWTDVRIVRDGSARPAAGDFEAAFVSAFDKHQRDRLAPLREVIPEVCRTVRTSPWHARRTLEKFVAARRLDEFAFEPALGKKVAAQDQVVAPGLEPVRTEPVPVDRISIGGRPVFTVARRI